MAKFEIQNYKGEVLNTVTSDELSNMMESEELNLFEYDSENDLVAHYAALQASDEASENFEGIRIFKKIEE